MATDLERLVVRLEAQASKFEREMARASGVADKRAREIERSFERVGPNIGASFAKIGAIVAGGLGVRELVQAADTYTKAINSLKVAGVSAAQVPQVFDALFASAQRNAVPLESLAQLYGRVSQAQSTLKASSSDLLGLTDIVAQSLRVSGASASQASGALLQLGQALSGGKVQAEEYNSLLDGMYPLLQAAAAGLKEAGGDVATLTKLVKDGEVSSQAFFRAIQAGAPILTDKLADAEATVEQATIRLKNEFVKAVGEFDRMVGVTPAVAAGMNQVSGSIGGVAKSAAEATNQIIALIQKLDSFGKAAAASIGGVVAAARTANVEQQRVILQSKLRGAVGPERIGIERQLLELDNNIFDRTGRNQERERYMAAGREAGDFGNVPSFYNEYRDRSPLVFPKGGGAAVKPISLKDYAVKDDDDEKGGGSSKEKLDEYEREIAAINRKTEALGREAEMVGKGTFAIEKSKAALELEQAAKKAGITVTEEMRAAIDKQSTAYAQAKVNVEEVKKAHDGLIAAQRFTGERISGVFSDMVSGGKNAQEAVMNLTKKLADAAFQAALLGQGPLASLFGMGAPSGGVGGILGGLFGGLKLGGFGGGGVATGAPLMLATGTSNVPYDNMPALLHKGEMVVPKYDADLLRGGRGGTGGKVEIVLTASPELDARIASTSRNVAVRVTSAAISENNNRLPSMLAEREAR